ncbi:phage tail protein [Xenorhabdus vietnamensis]|uniref:Phage tail protein n=1 Tax=Xenorhabdus vietnamensis TaxID=351656 RepID=A0A1Y2S9A2_9GAMM|nr:hypothetical protein [Xenorhabdus vietnamensis]OTA14121.1 phage tail protein [Xenorhabdus vietnamensis]
MGSYAPKGESYTKSESDYRYQSKGNYAPAGNYAIRGESYTKGESDSKYQSRGNYQPVGYSYSKGESDNKYQPKGNYAAAGSSYTKSESDARYEKKGTAIGTLKSIWLGDQGRDSSFTISDDIRGTHCYFRLQDAVEFYYVLMPPVDGVRIHLHQGKAGICIISTSNNGKEVNIYYEDYARIKEIRVIY